MNEAKISVIIPIYNREGTISRCLDSIIAQTYKNLEIICVDDGSKDKSKDICDEYASRDARIKVIYQENAGVSVARNTGLSYATGKWVSFIDSDDYIDENMYSTLLNAGEDAGVELVLSDLCMFSAEGIRDLKISLPSGIVVHKDEIIKDILPRFAIGGNDNIGLFAPTTKLYRLSVIKENDVCFPAGLSWGEDLYFVINYMANCSSLYYVEQGFYFYETSPNGLYSQFNLTLWKQYIKQYFLLTDFTKKYNLSNVNVNHFGENFIYLITWFLYRTRGGENRG